MFDALARLADRRARRVGLLAIVFFLAAGALGGSVADRLDPYGADDPATEAVQAREALQDAGHRIPGVIVVVEGAPSPSRLPALVSSRSSASCAAVATSSP